MPHRHCVSAETLVWISPRHIRWQTNLELEMVSVPEDSLFIVLLQRSKNWLNYKCYSRQTAVKSSHYVVTLQILHWPNTAEETIYKYFWILKYIYRKYFTLLPVKAWCIHYDELPQGTVMMIWEAKKILCAYLFLTEKETQLFGCLGTLMCGQSTGDPVSYSCQVPSCTVPHTPQP